MNHRFDVREVAGQAEIVNLIEAPFGPPPQNFLGEYTAHRLGEYRLLPARFGPQPQLDAQPQGEQAAVEKRVGDDNPQRGRYAPAEDIPRPVPQTP